MSELMGTLEFVRTYTDDLLCITKGSLSHLASQMGRERKVLASRRWLRRSLIPSGDGDIQCRAGRLVTI